MYLYAVNPLMKLESHFIHLFASFQVCGYPVTTLTMVRTKQMKRKPVKKPIKLPKKDWGTATLMIQCPLPHKTDLTALVCIL